MNADEETNSGADEALVSSWTPLSAKDRSTLVFSLGAFGVGAFVFSFGRNLRRASKEAQKLAEQHIAASGEVVWLQEL